MRLGMVLRKWRLMSELNLRTAGKAMHISTATLQRIEQGKDMDAQTLAKVLRWLMEAPNDL